MRPSARAHRLATVLCLTGFSAGTRFGARGGLPDAPRSNAPGGSRPKIDILRVLTSAAYAACLHMLVICLTSAESQHRRRRQRQKERTARRRPRASYCRPAIRRLCAHADLHGAGADAACCALCKHGMDSVFTIRDSTTRLHRPVSLLSCRSAAQQRQSALQQTKRERAPGRVQSRSELPNSGRRCSRTLAAGP